MENTTNNTLFETLTTNPWLTMNELRNTHNISDVLVKKSVAEGKVISHGKGKGMKYAMLGTELPQAQNFDQHTESVLSIVDQLRSTTSTIVAEHAELDTVIVRKTLQQLVEQGKINITGKKKGTRYVSITNPPLPNEELFVPDAREETPEVQQEVAVSEAD